MSTVIDTERARQILNNGMEQAETVLKDPDQIAGTDLSARTAAHAPG